MRAGREKDDKAGSRAGHHKTSLWKKACLSAFTLIELKRKEKGSVNGIVVFAVVVANEILARCLAFRG